MREDHSVNGITLYQNGLGIDDKLRSKKGNVVSYFLTDHLGSTVTLADANGAITSSTTYDSFGNATSNIATTYRYTGREYDSDTGLYYYRNRWYDPETGRFISEDPIGFAGGDVNLYGYVSNNPLSFIDPFGFWRCSSNDPPESSGWWDAVQGALDIAGLAPGVGILADLTNAGISVARGNYTDAALSMAAAVPVIGTAAGAGKLANRLNKVAKRAARASKGATRTSKKALPTLDATGKVHGALPKAKDLGRYSKQELRNLHQELKQSVKQRIKTTSRLGRDRAHGQRQGAEQDLIKAIEKHLKNR